MEDNHMLFLPLSIFLEGLIYCSQGRILNTTVQHNPGENIQHPPWWCVTVKKSIQEPAT